MKPILDVQNLCVEFESEDGPLRAVDQLSFTLKEKEILGIVGESGCGKSVSSLALMQLIPSPPGKVVAGKVLFSGEDLLEKKEVEMRKIRGKEISMIFQEPMTSLNPVFTIGNQIDEVLLLHESLTPEQAREKSIELLSQVGIPAPERRIQSYPHQLSGGMRQRAMIAMALACSPKVLIADEPTTALDVTIQAQILDLLKSLQSKFGMSIIFITHDLGVVSKFCDRVMVMYAGQCVEHTETKRLFRNPSHPYTEALLQSLPAFYGGRKKQRLDAISGSVPSLSELPEGCRFQDRCRYVIDECRNAIPKLKSIEASHEVRCVRKISNPSQQKSDLASKSRQEGGYDE